MLEQNFVYFINAKSPTTKPGVGQHSTTLANFQFVNTIKSQPQKKNCFTKCVQMNFILFFSSPKAQLLIIGV